MQEREMELKRFVVESLRLEDVRAEEIDSDASLFVDGLGLDSIDALELGMALNREYGLEIRADNEGNKDLFLSIRSMAAYIEKHGKWRE